MSNDRDKLIQELFKVVQDKKMAIAKAEKPSWLTNCAFRYYKESSISTNLQVCSDVEELVHIMALLIEKNNSFNKAQEMLGTNLDFKWFGFTFEDWSADISTRINKIEIAKKKKELHELEVRLDKLVSPELKAQLELEEIQKMLKG
jgi:hypothetical protein